jgi:hypothetical protein
LRARQNASIHFTKLACKMYDVITARAAGLHRQTPGGDSGAHRGAAMPTHGLRWFSSPSATTRSPAV